VGGKGGRQCASRTLLEWSQADREPKSFRPWVGKMGWRGGGGVNEIGALETHKVDLEGLGNAAKREV